MKVFISYGNAADQVTALRLQALGAANGLTVYVPPAHTRQDALETLDPDASRKLGDADVVLGVIGLGLSAACTQELNRGMMLRKNMIVMSYANWMPVLQPSFGSNLILIDPLNPGATEIEIVRHLKTLDAQQGAKNALLALGTLALGLTILATSDRS